VIFRLALVPLLLACAAWGQRIKAPRITAVIIFVLPSDFSFGLGAAAIGSCSWGMAYQGALYH
jgi:hypothetical protein